jgi:uncharacterized protein (DUF433 family)
MAAQDCVHKHPSGVYRIGETKVSLDSIVYSYLNGDSAESIQEAFPALSTDEIKAAIDFYLANRAEVHEYLKEQEALWEKVKAEIDAKPNPAWERLRKVKREQQGLP